ncbi:MAG: hypothetical protein EOP52_05980 [Sphingobacteriales bacterium]|nr:MAG: hypothetical protein EOP52_05980 [Sphingobacteriales bacterium]
MEILSKIQLSTYEKGEFSAEQSRSLAKTLELIQTFPWEEERKYLHTQDDIKSAVVLAGPEGNILKLTTFYNGTFQLLYLNSSGKEFAKTVVSLSDATPDIRSFFEGSFPTAGFTLQRKFFGRAKVYQTKDFTYPISFQQALWYSFFGTAFYIPVSVMMFVALAFNVFSDSQGWRFAAVAPMIILAPFYLYILIFIFNRYQYIKDKILIISKGNPVFQYGSKNHLKRYSKNDITRIITFQKVTPQSSFIEEALSITKLIFKDDEVLLVPQLLLREDPVETKFSGFSITNISKTIFLRKKHFAPTL